MKNFKNYLSYLAVFAMLFTSCSKEEAQDVSQDGDTALLTLGTSLADFQNSNKQSDGLPPCTGDVPAYALISFSYGDVTEENVEVAILSDADGLFTAYNEKLEIPVTSGNTVEVTLHDFKVYNEGDILIWLAPLEGSEYANFVNQPVGDDFVITLRAGSKNYTDVEVLCFDDRVVNKYGYQFFDLIPTPMMKFCLFGNICPDGPDGRHKTASYQVDVWEYNNGSKGDQLYSDKEALVLSDNGQMYADPLCFFLPDREGQDTYWFEITILDVDNYYDSDDRIILQGPITDDEIKNFYNGESGTMDYYHFQYGCEEDTPPPFFDPEDEAKHYKTCLYSLNDTQAVGFAYFSLKNNILETTVLAANLEANKIHPQHIHGFTNDSMSTCPPESAAGEDGLLSLEDGLPFYGGVLLSLTQEDGTWPMANASGILTYQRTFTLPVTEGSGEDASQVNVETLMPLENRAVVLHGLTVGGEYVATLPVACGQVSKLE